MLFPEMEDRSPRLVGIAKLAAQGRVLEEKSRVQYHQLPTRRFIGRTSGCRVPFDWTINPYRGCEFGCKYCFARYTHEFMELRETDQFETEIYAKQLDSVSFETELNKIARRDWIAMGTATDPYQPAERRFCVTRRILTVFAKTSGHRLSITTKSDLVARDADLLRAIADRNQLHVSITVTTLDRELARSLEPYAPCPELRVAAIQKLAQAGVSVSCIASPIMPLINDSEASLDALASAVSAAGGCYLGAGVLFLKPCAQRSFLPFLAGRFPHLLRRYEERFGKNAYLKGDYPDRIAARVQAIRLKYGLTRKPFSEEGIPGEFDEQPALFPLAPEIQPGDRSPPFPPI